MMKISPFNFTHYDRQMMILSIAMRGLASGVTSDSKAIVSMLDDLSDVALYFLFEKLENKNIATAKNIIEEELYGQV